MAAELDRAKLEAAPAIIKSVVDQGDLSGAITMVWRKGAVEHLAICGQRDREAGAPMQRDTLFRIASMTKPITSVAALMLIEEGVMTLDDPITKWAPEFANLQVLNSPTGPLNETTPAARDITIDDLFTHRSGLAYGFGSVGPIAHAYQNVLGDVLNGGLSEDAWMKALATLPLSYQPGERFHYSHSTDVLGFIVGRASGLGYREFLMQRIFGPLGMKDTDFYVPPEKRDRASVVYRQDQETGALNPVPFTRYDSPPAYCGGGGGLISTVDDYLTFARMMLGKGEVDGVRLLKPQSVELMTANRLTAEQRAIDFLGIPGFWSGQGFGLGVSVITDAAIQAWMGAGSNGAFGWPGAFGTWWQADPEEDMILIYLIQNSMELGPEAVANMGDARRMGARLALPMWQKAVYAALGK